jgi:hypothetical protein
MTAVLAQLVLFLLRRIRARGPGVDLATGRVPAHGPGTCFERLYVLVRAYSKRDETAFGDATFRTAWGLDDDGDDDEHFLVTLATRAVRRPRQTFRPEPERGYRDDTAK